MVVHMLLKSGEFLKIAKNRVFLGYPKKGPF